MIPLPWGNLPEMRPGTGTETAKTALWLGLAFFVLLSPQGRAQAQLADTIWEGVQTISGINLQGLRDRALLDYPVLRGGRTVFPLEIWFWDDTHFGIVFRNDRFDPARNGRKGEYLGWDYNNSEPDYAQSFTYTLRRNAGSFLGRSVRLVDSQWGWGYRGQSQQYSGRFTFKGNRLTTQKVVVTTDSFDMQAAQAYENPNEPGTFFPNRFDGFRFLNGKYPTFENTVWIKTSRKPSLQRYEPGYLIDP